MNALGIIAGVLLIAVCIIVIVCVTMMEGKTGLGTLAGQGGSNFFDQNRGKTREAMLKRATAYSGIMLAVLTLVVLFVV